MGYRELDLTNYPRRAHFAYFRTLAYPYAGLTANVDITAFTARRKEKGCPFFLTFTYCVTRAANAVPAFRQRIRGDGIVEYDWCPGSVTLAEPDGTFCFCTLSCRENFSDYLPAAEEAKRRALEANRLDGETDEEPLLFLSSVPWVSFTQVVHPAPCPADSNPRILWGKIFTQEGRTLIPVSVLCNHALCDGRHMADFYAALDRELASVF
ncbi:MAG: chloramphenicol acetyltransferase [Oscillospiraceae bacterium]|nr:chloramphenicol acetyltransferase [Oscillospiraceae bacterium]